MSKSQCHHIFSNKNQIYTPQYKEIMDRYGYALDHGYNLVNLSGHAGVHTIDYHEFMKRNLTIVNEIAKGDQDLFYRGMEIIKIFEEVNPSLPYGKRK